MALPASAAVKLIRPSPVAAEFTVIFTSLAKVVTAATLAAIASK